MYIIGLNGRIFKFLAQNHRLKAKYGCFELKFIASKLRLRHSSVQTTQNYADLLISHVGEQVGRVITLHFM